MTVWTPRRVAAVARRHPAVRRGVRRSTPASSAGSTACRNCPRDSSTPARSTGCFRRSASRRRPSNAPRGVRRRCPEQQSSSTRRSSSSATATRPPCWRRAAAEQPELQSRHARAVQPRRRSASRSPRHLRLPGEVPEITTFHADKAILEFDRAISNPNDMDQGEAAADGTHQRAGPGAAPTAAAASSTSRTTSGRPTRTSSW